jgi:hypothetical protein
MGELVAPAFPLTFEFRLSANSIQPLAFSLNVEQG